MSHNPLIPAKPTEITLDTLPQLFAHHRARFGGWKMEDPPERPEGVSEEEWNALGDPGKQVIIRERNARQEAERALAAARARPTPPPKPGNQPPAPTPQPTPPPAPQPGQQPDIDAIVRQAVEAAVKPFTEREEQRETAAAAQKVQDAVTEAAKARLHDASDALTNIDLTKVVNDQGAADPDKVKAELDALVTRKPHLAKGGQQLQAPPGIGGGAPATATEGEKVKAALAQMQKATGVRPDATN